MDIFNPSLHTLLDEFKFKNFTCDICYMSSLVNVPYRNYLASKEPRDTIIIAGVNKDIPDNGVRYEYKKIYPYFDASSILDYSLYSHIIVDFVGNIESELTPYNFTKSMQMTSTHGVQLTYLLDDRIIGMKYPSPIYTGGIIHSIDGVKMTTYEEIVRDEIVVKYVKKCF